MPKTSKNTTLFFAAIVIVLLGIMAYKTYRGKIAVTPQQKEATYEQEVKMIESQSDSDTVDDIEKDLIDTQLNGLDKELMDIEKELSS